MRCDVTQLILYTIITCTNSVYALASLFLPSVFEEKEIGGFWVGIVFATYSTVVVLGSPFVGTILNKCGFANLIAAGLVAMGISVIPYGFLKQIESNSATLALGIVLRAL